MENATYGKRNFNDVTSLLHGRLPEYPIFQRFLEIGLKLAHAQKVCTRLSPPSSQTPGYKAIADISMSSELHTDSY